MTALQYSMIDLLQYSTVAGAHADFKAFQANLLITHKVNPQAKHDPMQHETNLFHGYTWVAK